MIRDTILRLPHGFYLVALWFLLPTFVVVGLNMGLPTAHLPQLQGAAFGNSAMLDVGLFGAVKGLIALISAPLLGVASDKYGRQPLMIATFLALTIPPATYALFQNFLVFCVFDSIFGIFAASLSVQMAATADLVPATSSPTEKGHTTQALSVGMAAFGIGFGMGAIIGGQLSPRETFGLSALSAAAAAIYTAFFVPSVLEPFISPNVPTAFVAAPKDERERALRDGTSMFELDPGVHTDPSEALNEPSNQPGGVEQWPTVRMRPTSCCGWIRYSANVAVEMLVRIGREIARNDELRFIALIVFADSLAEMTMAQLLLLYLEKQHIFSEADNMWLIFVLGVSGVFCLLVTVPLLQKRIGTMGTLRVGLVANAVSIGLYAFVKSKTVAILLPLLTIFGFSVFPCASAIAAKQVSSSDEGLAQGVSAGARMLAEGASPAIMGYLFYMFQSTGFPGAPFLVAAGCVLIAVGMTTLLRNV